MFARPDSAEGGMTEPTIKSLEAEIRYLQDMIDEYRAEIDRLGKLDLMHIPTGMRRDAPADIEDFGD